jgi:PAS domain S-box-containing protein
MNTDRNLLFGVLALQADLIDAGQFVEACTLWATRKEMPLAEVLVQRGWLLPDDREHLDYLLQRKLARHGGDARASLATVDDEVKRSLAALGDNDIQQSLAGLPGRCDAHIQATIDHVPLPGERFQLTRLHATGGIGRVWLAHDSHLGRDVALKELRPERADNAQLARRFLQEARVTGQLEHPGIVPVYELGTHPSGEPFYTMRFVKGRTLSAAARTYHARRTAHQAESLDLLTLLNAFVTVCNTVAYAHSRGVIHRDLKGQNVLLGDFGEVVVLDWGLAKLLASGGCQPPEHLASGGCQPPEQEAIRGGHDPDSAQTQAGTALGTPAYMAPEQASGRIDLIDRRTDVYGLGAILYEILTGQPPFTGAETAEVLRKVREEEPVPPRQLCPDVPPALEAICLHALAKPPADRPAGASDMALEVQGWQDFERRKAEEALRKQTEILQSILNSMSDGVVVVDETGKVLLDNPASDRIRGAPMEDIPLELWSKRYGCYLSDSVTPYSSEQLPLARAMRGEEVNDAEVILRHEKRPEGVVLSVNSRPLRDKHGVVRGGLSVFRDVTARKKVEEELRKSRERFELAVLASQDGLWDWDVEADEVWYSPQMRKMLGYDEQEFPNRPGETEKRVHPDDHARWREVLHGHVEGTTDYLEMEYRILHKDGTYRWVRDRGVALRHPNGRAYRIAGSREDITRRKQAEEALRQSEEHYRSVIAAIQAELRQTAAELTLCKKQLRELAEADRGGKGT